MRFPLRRALNEKTVFAAILLVAICPAFLSSCGKKSSQTPAGDRNAVSERTGEKKHAVLRLEDLLDRSMVVAPPGAPPGEPVADYADALVGGEASRAILLARGTRLIFRSAAVPSIQPVFSVELALDDRTRVPADGEKAVFLISNGGPFQKIAEGEFHSGRWSPATGSLDAFAGKTVDLAIVAGEGGSQGGVLTAFRNARIEGFDVPPPEIPVKGKNWNAILITVDTLRADRLGAYGRAAARTPNFDALAKKSAVFENAFAPSSWTWPSTASLLTGLYSYTHGVIDSRSSYLSGDLTTLAEVFKNAGRETFAVSANPIVDRGRNFNQGFDAFVEVPQARAGELREAFEKFLNARRPERPFFAYLHFMDPHDPYDPPAPFRPQSSGKIPGMGDLLEKIWADFHRERGMEGFDPDLVEVLSGLYDGEISYWDSEFGALLSALKKRGLEENTLLAVVADHGEEFLEHGRLKHGMQLHAESLRVPLLIAGPGVPPGRRRDPASLLDAFPTLVDLAGIDYEGPYPLQGRNLLKEGSKGKFAGLFAETEHAWAGPTLFPPPLPPGETDAEKYRIRSQAVWNDRFKLIVTPGAPVPIQLYAAADAGETKNLAAESGSASDVEALRGELAAWMRDLPSPPKKRQPSSMEPELMERLRSLGYIQ